MKLSYRLGHTSIETLTNAQALLLVIISATSDERAPLASDTSDIVLRISPDATIREAVVLSRYLVVTEGRDLVVSCGDLRAGDERHVLVRFRCKAGFGPHPLAEISLGYREPGDPIEKRSLSRYVVVDRNDRRDVPELDSAVAYDLAMVKAITPIDGPHRREFPKHYVAERRGSLNVRSVISFTGT